MSITEAQRFEMHAGLRAHLGDDVANSLMEHLPPSGWSDVARKSDLDVVEKRIDQLEHHMEQRFTAVIAGMWAMGTAMFAGFVGLFTLIATKI